MEMPREAAEKVIEEANERKAVAETHCRCEAAPQFRR